MSGYGILAVAAGAALGTSLRRWLGLLLNPVFPTLPLGTLAVPLLGGSLTRLALEAMVSHAAPPSCVWPS